jgi:hypothetical protein
MSSLARIHSRVFLLDSNLAWVFEQSGGIIVSFKIHFGPSFRSLCSGMKQQRLEEEVDRAQRKALDRRFSTTEKEMTKLDPDQPSRASHSATVINLCGDDEGLESEAARKLLSRSTSSHINGGRPCPDPVEGYNPTDTSCP